MSINNKLVLQVIIVDTESGKQYKAAKEVYPNTCQGCAFLSESDDCLAVEHIENLDTTHCLNNSIIWQEIPNGQ